jgi:hypothetical protein
VWDISGITDDNVGILGIRTKPKQPEKPPIAPDMEIKPDTNTKILIDEDENMNMNGQNEYNHDLYVKK